MYRNARTAKLFGSQSRRTSFVTALGASLAGLSFRLGLDQADARKKRKRKRKKKIKRNAFGCVNVGGFCKSDEQCCSGICTGKKDKKTCQAHDQSTCQAGQTLVSCGGADEVSCTTGNGDDGVCVTTTGQAGYCANSGNCFPCLKDADCVPFCGPRAACVPCAEECAEEGTVCVGPEAGSCNFDPEARAGFFSA